ncbi:MAG: ABC transporter permease [Acidobacteriota bacterium]
MSLIEGMRLALASIWAHKLRSSLTLLANVVAVMSVIAVVSILSGMDHYVKDAVTNEGTGIFSVERVDHIQILTDFDAFLESLRNPNLGEDDADFLREHMTLAEYVGAERTTSARIDAGDRYVEGAQIRGRSIEYAFMRSWPLSAGRHLAPLEIQRRAPVTVIGSKTAEMLFPDQDPLGRTLKIGGKHIRVVGVVEEQAGAFGGDPNLFAFIPIGFFEKLFGSWDSISITIKASDLDAIRPTMDEARFFMRMRHRLGPSDREDFALTSADALLSLWKSISQGIFMSLTGISAISLLIGGIIIMNIMLVAVTERTREIGVRKAVGARRTGILVQVMAESMTLSLTGGITGIVLGFTAASVVAAFSPLPYAIETWSIVAGILVTGATGMIFGIYPANRAAGLDPIDALRSE